MYEVISKKDNKNYTDILNNLTRKIDNIIQNKNSESLNLDYDTQTKKKSPLMLIILPISVFIVSFIIKPTFVRKYDADLEQYSTSISIGKFVGWNTAISLCLGIPIYLYFFARK